MQNTCPASYADPITQTGKDNPPIFQECQMFLTQGAIQLTEIISSKQQRKIEMHRK